MYNHYHFEKKYEGDKASDDFQRDRLSLIRLVDARSVYLTHPDSFLVGRALIRKFIVPEKRIVVTAFTGNTHLIGINTEEMALVTDLEKILGQPTKEEYKPGGIYDGISGPGRIQDSLKELVYHEA